MKKFVAIAVLCFAGAPAARAMESVDLSKKYFFSNVRFGYMDHYHHEEKSRDLQFSFAGLGFTKDIQLVDYFIFEEGLKESGLSMPIKVNNRFYILPAVFRNYDAAEYGLALNVTVILR